MQTAASNKIDYDHPKGGWGRDGDQYMAHIAPGETIVPPVISPELRAALYKEMEAAGIPVEEYTVGDGMRPSINPETGLPEYGFFKKIKKAFKSVVKTVNKIPVIGPAVAPAVGFAVGGPAGAAAAAAIQTKVLGGSWGQAIGAAAGSYVGGAIGGPGTGTIGSNLNQAGAIGLTNTLGREISNASLSSISGSLLGSSIGTAVGGKINPPKQPTFGTSIANSYAPNPVAAPTASTPTGGSQGGVAIPAPANSGNPNMPQGPSAEDQALSAQRGAGITVGTPNTTYQATVIDRNTGLPRTVNTSFSNNFSRRNSWGGGVSFA